MLVRIYLVTQHLQGEEIQRNYFINLPRIAFEIVENKTASSTKDSIIFKKWEELADKVSLILLDRYKKTCRQDINLFPANKEYQLWSTPFEKDLVETFKNGTHWFLQGCQRPQRFWFDKKIYEDENLWRQTIDFVKFMRKKMNQNTNYYNLNFQPAGYFWRRNQQSFFRY